MIYTVTLNPAVDYVMLTDGFTAGAVNRSRGERIFFGGKGINVSLVLRELGVPSAALGFVAGFTGEAIENGVRAAGVETDFVHIAEGYSRINVKIRAAVETELNGSGPEISEKYVYELYNRLDKIHSGDTIVLAGSVPASLPPDIYERICERLSGRNVHIIADTTKDLLLNVLKYKPFLVKPNHHELGEIFGVKLEKTGDIIDYAGKLREMGAENVLVSRAGDGAVLLDEYGKAHICGVCRGSVKNSVGAGDSMVAGFLAAVAQNEGKAADYDYALRLGTAAGGATAFSEGLAKKDEIYDLLEQLN